MPTIKTVSVLAANGVAFPLQGSQYEFLPWNARVRLVAFVDPGEEVSAFVSSGSDILMSNAPLDEKAATDPITLEDYQLEDFALAGERIVLELREVGGNPARVRSQIELTPV
jgi:hypothetical protein